MELISGASVSDLELKRVSDALEALRKDNHAPREMTVAVTLHVHNEFPKLVYKGKEERSVSSQEEADQAAADGFGPYDHEAYTAEAK